MVLLHKVTALALLGALALGMTGCGPEYDHTDIGNVREGMFGGRVDRARVEVRSGMIVTARVVAYNDDDEVMATVVRSTDPGVIEVASTITANEFAFIGQKEGTAEIEVLADGKNVLIISAVVLPQPSSP